MLESHQIIRQTGTIMVNNFVEQPLTEALKISSVDIIFPENRIADVVKLKPLMNVRLWHGQKLVIDDAFDKLAKTHKVGAYQIKIADEVYQAGEQLWLSFNFPIAPILSEDLPVLVRVSSS